MGTKRHETARRTLGLVAAVAVVASTLGVIAAPATPVQAASLVVNSVGDESDVSPGDGVCLTAVGTCTLRAAIEESNALAGADSISFAIPGSGVQTITPSNALPYLDGPVTIDGTTQPGADCSSWPPTLLVELDLTMAGAFGLVLRGGSSTIRGLVMNRVSQTAIGIGSSNNRIECNFLGTNPNGATIGSTFEGIWAYFASAGGNTIVDNLIANTALNSAMFLTSDNNVVQGNWLQVTLDGTPFATCCFGRAVYLGGSGNLVGGPGAGEGNVIGAWFGDGVEVRFGTGNTIRGNVFPRAFCNPDVTPACLLGLDIDLVGDTDPFAGGVTPNDAEDGDTGPNNFQNYPVLSSAVASATSLTVEGSLDSQAFGAYAIDIYHGPACHVSGHGGAQVFAGTFNVDIDGTGEADFSETLAAPVPVGSVVIATATDTTTGDTSEMSACIEVTGEAGPGVIVPDGMSWSDVVDAGWAVALSDIPVDRLSAAAEAITGTPLRSVDLRESPLRAIPIGAIPLRAIPLRAIGSNYDAVLSDVTITGGWRALLVDTPLAGLPLATITLSEAFDVIPEERLEGLTLSDIDPGRSALGSLDVGTLLLGDHQPDTGSTIAATPLRAIPLRAIPLGAIPLRAIPLRAIPLGAIPLGAIPVEPAPLRAIGDLAAAPLGAIPLGAIPLRAIPLGAIDLSVSPLGAIPLRAIPLGAIPLRAIQLDDLGTDFCADVHDVDPTIGVGETCAALGIDPDVTTVLEYAMLLGADGLAATPLRAIPLGAIPLGAIPLGAIDISGIPLGAIPLRAIDLQASPLGAIPLRAIGGCADALEDALEDASICGTDMTLAQYLASTGESSLEATPLRAIDIASLPLRAIPLRAIEVEASPLRAIEIAGVPLGAIPLRAIDLDVSPLGAIEINGVPLRAIPLGTIDNMTVGDLFSDLGSTGASFVMGDILEHLTLAFLGETEGFGDMNIGTVLLGLLLASDFPWEDMPLNEIETRDVACGEFDLTRNWCLGSVGSTPTPTPDVRNTLAPENVAVRVWFEVLDNAVTDAVLHLTLDGAIPAPGSAALEVVDLPGEVLDEPLGSGNTWRYLLPALQPGVQVLDLSLLPGLALGERTFSVEIRSSGGDVSFGSGNYFVVAPDRTTTTTEPINVQVDTLYIGYIDEPGATDWYEVPSPGGAGYRVAVYLSNLAGDVDTFVYRPSTAPISGVDTQRTIPLASYPVEDSGIVAAGVGTLSPEILADSGVDETLTIAASSTNRGSATESAVFFSRVDEPSYKIQITGYDQATSQTPYVLRVKFEPVVTPSSCPAVELLPIGTGASPVIPAGATTLFLTNPQRMSHLYGSDAQAEVAADLASLLSATVDGEPLVNGALVDIAGIPGVAGAFGQWDLAPCEPDRANRVAGLVQQWIQETVKANPSLRHVAIIGSDEVIPFARLADSTVIANESTYVEDFTPGSALHGAHSNRTYLSDAPYGDLDPVPWLDRYAYLPELGVGRLVETPAQIRGAIQTFIEFDGVLAPETAAVAGYDFLTDGAERVKKNLVGVEDLDPTGALLTETWSRAALIDRAYNLSGVAPDIISPNAHFDHYRSLPALGNLTKDESDLFTIDDVDAITGDGVDLTRRIVFTMGCHAGLNVPANTAVDPDLDRDWAEVYTAERAIFVGNTGYGYGDTATVALTEQLMANFAFYLDGDRTIGQALSQAKQDQFGRAGLYGVYDLKAIEQSTLYGLPMWEIDGPGRPKGKTPIGVRSLEPVTGLQASSFTITPNFVQETTPIGTYWSADGDTQFLHWRPIQPKVSVDVTQDGVVATGVLLTDIDSTDYSVADAAFARPMTVSGSGREPEIESDDIIFPATFVTLGTSAELNLGDGEPTLLSQSANIIPGQFIGPAGEAQRQRIFTKTTALVYYVDEADLDDIDWTPPLITRVDADTFDGIATFEVDTHDPQTGVSRVVVLYRYAIDGTKSDWQAIDLTPLGTSGTWAGAGTYDSSVSPPLDYLVQSVNGDGVVGVSTYKGELHSTDVLTEPPTDPTPVVVNPACNGAPCSPAPYSAPVTIDAPGALISVNGGVGTPSPVTIPDDGHHLVMVQKNGSTSTFSIEIRIPNPQIQVAKTTDDDTYSTVGQTLTYQIDVTNTGNVTLTDIDVTDPAADPDSLDCGTFDGQLEPDDTITCTATITVTQADLDAGSVVNTASVTGNGPNGAAATADSNAVAVPAAPEPALTVVKTTDDDSYTTRGQTLTYQIQVTNTGNVTVFGVVVTDSAADPDSLVCTPASSDLAPNESVTCTATLTISQGDLDAGSVFNVASADGLDPTGEPVSADSNVIEVPAVQSPAIQVSKTTDDDTYSTVGQVLSYQITVANTGNVTLTDLEVIDPAADTASIDCNSNDLELVPGDTVTCTATITVTDADIGAGSIVNVATATGAGPSGTTAHDDDTVTLAYAPLFTFGGFQKPLHANPAVLNLRKAGSTVPVKWALYDDEGRLVTSTEGVWLTNQLVTCDAAATPLGPESPAPTDKRGLRVKKKGFDFKFKTDKAWAGNCGILTIHFNEHQTATARFGYTPLSVAPNGAVGFGSFEDPVATADTEIEVTAKAGHKFTFRWQMISVNGVIDTNVDGVSLVHQLVTCDEDATPLTTVADAPTDKKGLESKKDRIEVTVETEKLWKGSCGVFTILLDGDEVATASVTYT